jgi:catechol 2,3-dioxygenase-like lactoylglutathione lyase family enzyme
MFEASRAYSSFAVPDVDAARAFYADTLGLRAELVYEGGLLDISLPGGDAHVLVYPKADHVPAVFTVLNFPVDDLDAAVGGLRAVGVEMARFEGFDQDELGIARSTGQGPDIAWFRDPAGNIIAVHSNEGM